MKKIFYTLFLSLIVIAGCKKEGCIDSTATNYDSDAKKDDGSCTYASTNTGNTNSSTNNGGTGVGGGTTQVDKCNPSSEEVVINGETWKTKNLNVVVFNNGDSILHAKTDAEWENASSTGTPAYCVPPSMDQSKTGLLYNHFVVQDSRGVCPDGYHVPSALEFETLIFGEIAQVDSFALLADFLKTTCDWKDLDGIDKNGTNESGFYAYPAGIRSYMGNYAAQHGFAIWWESDEPSETAYTFSVSSLDESETGSEDLFKVGNGGSIRCIKD